LLLEKPSYLYSLNLFQTAGVRLCGLLLDSGGINLAAVSYQKRLTQSPFLYTIPCFNNPTGVLMSEKRRKDLLNICEQEELAIIEDDVYRELWLDSPPPPPIKAFDKTGLVIYLGSLSKSLSPGLRVGWIVGPETVIDRLADIKMQNDYGTSSLSQWVAAQWLASGLYQENLINIRNQLAFRRDICLSTLEANFKDIATWTTPPGGFYVWLNLKDNIPLSKLFKTALKKGILIHPGNIYDRFSTNQIRISFCYSTVDQIKFGLQELARTIREILLQHN
jgi:GntR family transcriptional regulator of abcA and norABC